MPRGVILILILLALLIGGAVLLSKSADEVPLTNIEADVSNVPTAQ